MKRKILAAVVLFSASAAGALAHLVIDEDSLGLSKGNVFDVPEPKAFDYPTTDPAMAQALPRAYQDAPPQIPHRVDMFLPVLMDDNKCIMCHDKPTMIGQKLKGMPTPISATHYVQQEDQSLKLKGARFVCTQCHAPQAAVDTMVESTFAPEFSPEQAWEVQAGERRLAPQTKPDARERYHGYEGQQ
jgi:nitrate reductase (cytochrome), electron transfer subunit